MNIKYIFLLLATVAFGFSSCGKKGCTDPSAANFDMKATVYDGSCDYSNITSNFKLKVNAKMGSQDFKIKTPLTDANGNLQRIELFKFLISNITLVGADNSETRVREVALIDYNPDNNITEVEMRAPIGDYTGLKFDFGVPENLNKSNPADYAIEHPLSSSNNMHWDWASMYKFVVYEGFVDTTGSGSQYDHFVAYHSGASDFYQPVNEIEEDFTVVDNEFTNVEIEIDLDAVFSNVTNPIDIKTDPTTHTTDNKPLAEKFSNNFAAAFSGS